jgi:putative zinc finger protein
MTERPMEEDSTTHPDEGMIHAWLDDALDAPAAAGIAEHVRTCPVCTERVAEARGLIAGASRIVASLDDVPAGARPVWAQTAPETDPASTQGSARPNSSLWRSLRVTPARAAIAATILVALGITMTRPRSGPDDVRSAATSGELAPRAAPMSDQASSAIASAPARAPDPLLDSAIARNLAIAQPKRALDAVHEPSVPVPTQSQSRVGFSATDTSARTQVAIGRRELETQRETRVDVADKARVRGAVSASASTGAPTSDLSGAVAAVPGTAADSRNGASVASKKVVGVAISCFKIDSPVPGARWGGELLPLIVSADSASRAGFTSAEVLTASGEPTSIRAQFRAGGADSLTLQLRGVGYSGAITLGPDVGGRVGLAYSAPAGRPEEVATASPRERDAGAVTSLRKAGGTVAGAARADSPAPPSAPLPNAMSRPAPSAGSRVTLRRVSCPVR